jgi:hypothetical protein
MRANGDGARVVAGKLLFDAGCDHETANNARVHRTAETGEARRSASGATTGWASLSP